MYRNMHIQLDVTWKPRDQSQPIRCQCRHNRKTSQARDWPQMVTSNFKKSLLFYNENWQVLSSGNQPNSRTIGSSNKSGETSEMTLLAQLNVNYIDSEMPQLVHTLHSVYTKLPQTTHMIILYLYSNRYNK